MKRYQPSSPRAASIIAAIGLTVLSMAAAIVAPAKLDPSGHEASAPGVQPSPVVVRLAHIQVRAPREPESEFVHVRSIQPKPKQAS
jgi:hypothetical protein